MLRFRRRYIVPEADIIAEKQAADLAEGVEKLDVKEGQEPAKLPEKAAVQVSAFSVHHRCHPLPC